MDPTEEPIRPIINIEGEKVVLGPRRRELLPLYQRWINDFEVTRTLASGLVPWTFEQEEEWYRESDKSKNRVIFTVYERSTMRPIGSTGLHEVDYHHGSAEFGILIGEKDCWGKGYATETASLMLDYGFTCEGLHSVMLHVHAYNERAIRAYRRAGFRETGRLRECHRLGQDFHDVVIMDCLATEFRSPLLHRLLPETSPPRTRSRHRP